MSYKRILIIGCSGAGKSTLARQLADMTKLPLIHLDQLFWQPHWVPTDRALFRANMLTELQKPAWIIDGNFDSTLDLRMQYADCIIFLDYRTDICIRRILRRYITNVGKTRPDMTSGCNEKLDIEFLQWIMRYKKDVQSHIVQKLAATPITSIILTHPTQTKQWLASLRNAT